MKNKIKVLLILVLTISCLCSSSVFAAEISIDGNMSDWTGVESTDISRSSIFFNNVSIVKTSDFLYMHVNEKSTMSWEKYFTYCCPVIVDSNGNETNLVLRDGSFTQDRNENIEVRNQNGYVIVNGSSGIRTKNDTYEWELAIPLSEVGDAVQVKLKVDYSNYMSFTPSSLENGGSGEVETSFEETTQENTTVSNEGSGIVIDGSYDDWATYPHSFVTNWDMPEDWRNESNCRQLSVIMDDENIYFHVKMIGGWNDPFNGNEYLLTVEGKTIGVFLFNDYGQAFPGGYVPYGVSNVNVFYKNKTGHINDQTLIPGASAKLTKTFGEPDEAEVKIPLDIFKKVYGIDISDIKEVTLKNPNLFHGKITAAGTSTGPIIGVAVCLASVAVGYALIRLKFRRKNCIEK